MDIFNHMNKLLDHAEARERKARQDALTDDRSGADDGDDEDKPPRKVDRDPCEESGYHPGSYNPKDHS